MKQGKMEMVLASEPAVVDAGVLWAGLDRAELRRQQAAGELQETLARQEPGLPLDILQIVDEHDGGLERITREGYAPRGPRSSRAGT